MYNTDPLPPIKVGKRDFKDLVERVGVSETNGSTSTIVHTVEKKVRLIRY